MRGVEVEQDDLRVQEDPPLLAGRVLLEELVRRGAQAAGGGEVARELAVVAGDAARAVLQAVAEDPRPAAGLPRQRGENLVVEVEGRREDERAVP